MGGAEDHDLRRAFLDERHERRTVGRTAEDPERGILDEMHPVRPRREKLVAEGRDVRAHQDGRKRHAQPIREFASLPEEFARHVTQLSVFLFGEDPHLALASITSHLFSP